MEHLRMCTVCREMKPKESLTRIVKTNSGEIFIDPTKKADGRGAYICDNCCTDKLKKIKPLNKAFKCVVPDEIYDKLITKEN
ncbi:MAG: YlxR family protein [Firmicutes bacterium]|nr:YlxR family protein [Bacillota bacterium]MDY3659004.1 YlxR family protein [Eubacteriales bacterium]